MASAEPADITFLMPWIRINIFASFIEKTKAKVFVWSTSPTIMTGLLNHGMEEIV